MLLHAILLLLGSLVVAESRRPCSTSLIRGVSTEKVNFDLDPHVRVICSGDPSELKAIQLVSGPDNLRSNKYDSLTCHASEGWFANGVARRERIADANATVDISCVSYTLCSPSRFNTFIADEINIHTSADGTGALYCNYGEQSLALIRAREGEFESLHELLICSDKEEGWTPLIRGMTVYFTRPRRPQTVSCVEYCAATGSGIVSRILPYPRRHYEDTYYHQITCADKSHKLFHNGQRVKDDTADCKFSSKTWKFGYTDYATTGDYTSGLTDIPLEKPQQFECRNDPTQGGKRSVRAMRTAEGKQEE